MKDTPPLHPSSPEPKPAVGPGPRSEQEARLPRFFLQAFLVWSLAATAAVCAGWEPSPRWRWLELVLPVLGCLSALGSLARRLPLQNLLAIGSLILFLSAGLVACGARSHIPFGPIRYAENAGFMLFGQVPLALPFWWAAILVSSRETARLILRPWRHSRSHGFRVVSLAAGLAVVTDLNWEPFAVELRHLWQWDTNAPAFSWYSAPWVNFLGWFVSGLILLGFSTPWFITKRPVHLAPRLDPALIWCALNLHFIAGNAAGGLWPAVLVGGGLSAAAAGLSWWSRCRPVEHS